MASYAYNSVVAGRTRAAAFIQSNPELLARFIDRGGLPSDLETIIAKGRAAEAANLGQSSASALGEASTGDAAAAFAALQREYKAVMAIVRAVRDDLEDAGAPREVVEGVNKILKDETAVHVKTVKGEDDRSIKKALRKRSQEAVRTEIRKDAAALIDHAATVSALAARRVDAARLTKLRDDADALSGKLSARAANKAQRKAVTGAESAAARAQAKKWNALRRILRSIDDDGLEAVLRDTRR